MDNDFAYGSKLVRPMIYIMISTKNVIKNKKRKDKINYWYKFGVEFCIMEC